MFIESLEFTIPVDLCDVFTTLKRGPRSDLEFPASVNSYGTTQDANIQVMLRSNKLTFKVDGVSSNASMISKSECKTLKLSVFDVDCSLIPPDVNDVPSYSSLPTKRTHSVSLPSPPVKVRRTFSDSAHSRSQSFPHPSNNHHNHSPSNSKSQSDTPVNVKQEPEDPDLIEIEPDPESDDIEPKKEAPFMQIDFTSNEPYTQTSQAALDRLAHPQSSHSQSQSSSSSSFQQNVPHVPDYAEPGPSQQQRQHGDQGADDYLVFQGDEEGDDNEADYSNDDGEESGADEIVKPAIDRSSLRKTVSKVKESDAQARQPTTSLEASERRKPANAEESQKKNTNQTSGSDSRATRDAFSAGSPKRCRSRSIGSSSSKPDQTTPDKPITRSKPDSGKSPMSTSENRTNYSEIRKSTLKIDDTKVKTRVVQERKWYSCLGCGYTTHRGPHINRHLLTCKLTGRLTVKISPKKPTPPTSPMKKVDLPVVSVRCEKLSLTKLKSNTAKTADVGKLPKSNFQKMFDKSKVTTSVRSNRTWYSCVGCDYATKRPGHMQRHLRTGKHKLAVSTAVVETVKPKTTVSKAVPQESSSTSTVKPEPTVSKAVVHKPQERPSTSAVKPKTTVSKAVSPRPQEKSFTSTIRRVVLPGGASHKGVTYLKKYSNRRWRYWCKSCNYITEKRTYFDKHFSQVHHLNTKHTQSKETPAKAMLKKKNTSSGKKHFCKLCSYFSLKRSNLIKHMKSKVHSQQQKRSGKAKAPNRTSKVRDPDSPNSTTRQKTPDETPKKTAVVLRYTQGSVMCGVCNVRFENRKTLHEHVLTHFQYFHTCDACNKNFAFKCDLNKHKTTCKKIVPEEGGASTAECGVTASPVPSTSRGVEHSSGTSTAPGDLCGPVERQSLQIKEEPVDDSMDYIVTENDDDDEEDDDRANTVEKNFEVYIDRTNDEESGPDATLIKTEPSEVCNTETNSIGSARLNGDAETHDTIDTACGPDDTIDTACGPDTTRIKTEASEVRESSMMDLNSSDASEVHNTEMNTIGPDTNDHTYSILDIEKTLTLSLLD